MLSLNFIAIMAYVFVAWLTATKLRRADIIDAFWGPGFVVVAWLTCLRGNFSSLSLTQLLLLLAVSVWGTRLGLHLLIRWWREAHEDRRYAAMRASGGSWWWLRSLVTVFCLQGTIMWIVALPLQFALSAQTAEHSIGLAVGAILFCVGLFFEAIGDWQLTRFRNQKDNAQRVLNTGLWRYTRHPNYFGDFAVWWGFFALSVAIGAPLWTVVSPLIMSALLMKFSGVGLLEKDITSRRPGYSEYVAATNAFFPWPPGKSG